MSHITPLSKIHTEVLVFVLSNQSPGCWNTPMEGGNRQKPRFFWSYLLVEMVVKDMRKEYIMIDSIYIKFNL